MKNENPFLHVKQFKFVGPEHVKQLSWQFLQMPEGSSKYYPDGQDFSPALTHFLFKVKV